MVAVVLTLLWRQVPGVQELTRLLALIHRFYLPSPSLTYMDEDGELKKLFILLKAY